MHIDDVPVIDLSKVEFLEKLGEGNYLKFLTLIGAFGKVRLCKIKKRNLESSGISNRSAPVKTISSITMAKSSTGKDD